MVTIAIVITLAGFMLPAANKAIVSARMSASLSNLRQVGTALDLYTADHDNLYPLVFDSISWLEMTWPYIYPGKKFPGTSPPMLRGSVYYTPMVESGTTPRTWGLNQHLETQYASNRRYRLVLSNQDQIGIAGDVRTSGSFRTDQINFRNNGRAHVLFLDGHLSALKPDEVPTTNTKIFWIGINK